MTIRAQLTANDYRIRVEPLTGIVEARRGAHVVARSAAARVMYETRLPPVIYFPGDDVLAPLVRATDTKTFCPFKGTASYAHVQIGDDVVENGAWFYEQPLPEGQAVSGYVAFMPAAVDSYDLGGRDIGSFSDGHITGPTVDWLLRDAWTEPGPEELIAALGRQLVADGIAVYRLAVLIWSLHPMIAARHYVWRADDGSVDVRAPFHDQLIASHAFFGSPLHHVSEGLGGVRQKLDANPDEFSFPFLEDLKAQGAADYVAMPLPFSNGQINVLTLASRHPAGFTTANLGLVFECSAIISRLFEVHALKSNAKTMLETYVGPRTGARVLGGEIRRGDGDVIEAAILFCDLRGSTRLEAEHSRDDYVALLNRFFERTMDCVNAHGGEVLKFIGDAVLAIFPVVDDRGEACRTALASAADMVAALNGAEDDGGPPLSCGIGLAVGEVTYGNVGSKERLDFTVIGRAANLAARLSDYGKRAGYPIVMSGDVAGCSGEKGVPLGALTLHNIKDPVDAFAIGER